MNAYEFTKVITNGIKFIDLLIGYGYTWEWLAPAKEALQSVSQKLTPLTESKFITALEKFFKVVQVKGEGGAGAFITSAKELNGEDPAKVAGDLILTNLAPQLPSFWIVPLLSRLTGMNKKVEFIAYEGVSETISWALENALVATYDKSSFSFSFAEWLDVQARAWGSNSNGNGGGIGGRFQYTFLQTLYGDGYGF